MSIHRTGLIPRPQFVRDARIFVIAVEGEKTEEQYFSLFGSSRVHVEVLSAGSGSLSAPKHVLERLVRFEQQYDLGPEDERWFVADVDRQRGQFLAQVTQIARDSGYHLAISNPCFELWLLLHFREADPADTECRSVIERRLNVPARLTEGRKTAGQVLLEHTSSRSLKSCFSCNCPD